MRLNLGVWIALKSAEGIYKMSEQLIKSVGLAEQLAYAENAKRNGAEVANMPFSDKEVITAIEETSKILHETWRKGIEAGFVEQGLAADKPRMRVSKDKTEQTDIAWYESQEAVGVTFERDAESGKRLVNTNVPYDELSPSWQNANIGAANFAVNGVVEAAKMGVDVTSNEFIEAMSDEIHEQWMVDNSWEKDSKPELFIAYKDLTEDEKKKDRDQVLVVLESLGYK